MAVARRLPHAALDGAAARHRQHPPARRADADHRAVARARAGAAGHRDRRSTATCAGSSRARCPSKAPSFYFVDIQSADADTLRRLRCGSTRRRRRSSACRCCAAASCRRTASRPTTSSRSRTPPGCCRATAASPIATEVPHGSTRRRGRLVGAGLQGAAAGLVREEDRRRARPEDRRSGRRQRARPQHRRRRIANLRTVDWENLGINFVLVFSPSAFAGAPHTDIATLTYPGGGTLAQETALLQGGQRRLSGGHQRCGSRTRSRRSATSCAISCSAIRGASARGAGRRRCWCSAARSRPATATASTTRSCSRRSAPRAAS